jgi:hypothetical protein
MIVSVRDHVAREFCGDHCLDRYARERGEWVEPKQLELALGIIPWAAPSPA